MCLSWAFDQYLANIVEEGSAKDQLNIRDESFDTDEEATFETRREK